MHDIILPILEIPETYVATLPFEMLKLLNALYLLQQSVATTRMERNVQNTAAPSVVVKIKHATT